MARGDGIWLAYSLDGTIMVPFGDRVKCLEHAVANQLTYRRADFGVNLLAARRPPPIPAADAKPRKRPACSVCGQPGHRAGSPRCQGPAGQIIGPFPETSTERQARIDQMAGPGRPVFGIAALRASADRIAAGEQAPAGSPGATLGLSALLDHLALNEARASVELDRDQTHVVDGPVTVGAPQPDLGPGAPAAATDCDCTGDGDWHPRGSGGCKHPPGGNGLDPFPEDDPDLEEREQTRITETEAAAGFPGALIGDFDEYRDPEEARP